MYLIWILGSTLILSNNQSRETLWVLDTCLIVGLLPFIIILITASLSQKCGASKQIKKTSRSTKRDQHHQIQIVVLGWILVFYVVVLHDRFPCDSWSFELLIWFGEEWNTSITKCQRSSAGLPSMRKSASRQIISASVELWKWSLFLAHPNYWHERVVSENELDSTWCWFWVF